MAFSYKYCRIKPENRLKIKELIDKKMKVSQIAREMGLNYTTFYAELKRNKINAQCLELYDPIQAQKTWDDNTNFSKKKFREFSEKEREKIAELVSQGRSKTYIARELWAGIKTISSYLAGKNMHVVFGGLKTRALKERLENLEQQVEILTDLIKEMRNEQR
jgi:IS30 family transposase